MVSAHNFRPVTETETHMPEFKILIYGNESGECPAPGTAEFADSMAPRMELSKSLVKSQRMVAGSRLGSVHLGTHCASRLG